MTSTANTAVPAGATSPAPRSGTPLKRRRRTSTRQLALPYLLLAPAVVTMLAIIGYPAVLVVLTSFRKLDLGELVRGRVVWIGLDNYRVVFGDPAFWTITLRTILFTAACVALTLVAALLIALLMRHVGPVIRVLLQVSLVLTWAMPVLAATTVFQWIFDQRYGILNKTLVLLGFSGFTGYSWFATGLSTLAVIGLLIIWQAVPFVAFTLYAGVLGVSRELYEAAGLDGASPLQTFRAVTWPTLRPLMTTCTFLSVLWDFKVFAQVWAIREGGPSGGSTTLSVLQYLKGFAGSHFGVAAAVSVLMILILIVVTAQYLRLLVRSPEGRL